MANCADCGANPQHGCKSSCPKDRTKSVWARYRARKRAKLEAEKAAKQTNAGAGQ